MSDIQIGVTNFDSRGPRNPTYYLKAGSNFYRVLPPMHSLAAKSKYAQYHQTHRITTSDGKTFKFNCIEEKDRNTRAVTKNCPLCDLTTEKRAQYESAKQQGANREQLKEFNDSQIFPIAPEKKYFVNAVDQENRVAPLCLPIKAFKDLDSELKKIKNSKGIDGTSLQTGIFFNFEREGSGFQTTYKVTSMRESVQTDQGIFEQEKRHVVTEDTMEQIKSHSRDLGNLFKDVSYEDISALAKSDSEGRKLVADRIFARPQQTEKTQTTIESSAPGFGGVTAVNTLNVGAQGTKVDGPFVQPDLAKTNETPVVSSTPPSMAPVTPSAAPEAQALTPPVTSEQTASAVNEMSDDQFNSMFMNGNGNK